MKGLQVVTLALNLPGPLAAKRLLALGAEVVKVEPPQGDPFEHYNSEWYQDLNNQQSIRKLDLKSQAGLQAFDRLLKKSDLLITAQRPVALERLGLDWVGLQRKFPSLNHLAIVGYPEPNQNHAGHDLTYQASLGLLSPPHMPKTLVADMAGAERAAFEGLAMLMASKLGESGQRKVIALSEAAEYMAMPLKYGLTGDGAMLGGRRPEYALYDTKSGWVAIAAIEPHFKLRLQKGLDLLDLSHDAISKKLKTKSALDWVEWANERDIPLVEVKKV